MKISEIDVLQKRVDQARSLHEKIKTYRDGVIKLAAEVQELTFNFSETREGGVYIIDKNGHRQRVCWATQIPNLNNRLRMCLQNILDAEIKEAEEALERI